MGQPPSLAIAYRKPAADAGPARSMPSGRDNGLDGEPHARAIGRELPLAELIENLKYALGGAGRTCLVTGEAGIGKTRLLSELLERAQGYNCHILSGKAQEYDHGIAHSSLRDILASTADDDINETCRADLAELVRALDSAVLGQPSAPEQTMRVQPATLLMRKFLHSLCLDKPTMVTLDDAHLADDETLVALSFAARHLSEWPLLLVFTTRLDKWLPGTRFASTVGRLIDSVQGTVVQLAPLDADDTAALVAADLSARPDERLAAYVYSQSRGNPLFARQALWSLRELGAIRSERGRCYLVGNPAAGALSRRAALLHRVFQQDRPGRELARVMSAFRRVHIDQIDTLEAATGMSRDSIERAFDSLVRGSILTRVSADCYEFAHPMIAEVLHNDLGPLERRRLHKLIAESYDHRQASAGTDVLERTTHIAEAAAPGDPAALAAVLDAARLTRNTAPLSAATWYQRAVELLPPESAERGDLLSRQAIALWKGSRPEAAIEVGKRALAVQGSGDLRIRTLATVVNATYAMGRYADALRVVSALAKGVSDPTPFLAQRALLLAHMGRGTEAAAQLDQVMSRAQAGSLGSQVVTYTYVGHVFNCLGDFSKVSVAIGRLLSIGEGAERGAARGAKLSALESAGYLLAVTGCLPRARELLARVADLLPETGWQDVGGQYVYAKAKLEHMSGCWEEALETIRSGAISLEFAGLRNNLAWLRLLEVEILTDQAKLDEASRILEKPLLEADCLLYTILHTCRAARITAALGDNAQARKTLLEALQLASDRQLAEARRRCLEALAEISLADCDQGAAREYASDLRQLATQTGVPSTLAAADMAEIMNGDVAAGLRLVSQYEEQGRLFSAAQAHFYLAHSAGDAEDHLARAHELFTAMSAQLWLPRVHELSKRLGVTVTTGSRQRSRAKDHSALTRTENQLVQLLRQGLTNRQISSILHYSPKTIEVYVSRLYQKVGCHSRLELVVAAERGEINGLTTSHERVRYN
jgi:DNA-binding CsgD family transcriptional regulator/tetratricopeptide (TPR) repeat protein